MNWSVRIESTFQLFTCCLISKASQTLQALGFEIFEVVVQWRVWMFRVGVLGFQACRVSEPGSHT